jgi:hypothetical protein
VWIRQRGADGNAADAGTDTSIALRHLCAQRARRTADIVDTSRVAWTRAAIEELAAPVPDRSAKRHRSGGANGWYAIAAVQSAHARSTASTAREGSLTIAAIERVAAAAAYHAAILAPGLMAADRLTDPRVARSSANVRKAASAANEAGVATAVGAVYPTASAV